MSAKQSKRGLLVWKAWSNSLLEAVAGCGSCVSDIIAELCRCRGLCITTTGGGGGGDTAMQVIGGQELIVQLKKMQRLVHTKGGCDAAMRLIGGQKLIVQLKKGLTVASGNAEPFRQSRQRWEAACEIDVIAVEDGQAVGDGGHCRKFGNWQPCEGDLQH